MSDPSQPWNPVLNWDTPAGRALQALAAAVPLDRHLFITVFGSAPLQMAIDSGLLSADTDVFSPDNLEEIIRPALARRKAGYDAAPPEHRNGLQDIAD